MPTLLTQHSLLYYDLFSPEIARTSFSSPKTLLLVHGFAGTPTSDFADQLPAFQARYQVLAPHLHGYGQSTHRKAYTLDFYRADVADLVALLDDLQLEQVYVVGFSDG